MMQAHNKFGKQFPDVGNHFKDVSKSHTWLGSRAEINICVALFKVLSCVQYNLIITR